MGDDIGKHEIDYVCDKNFNFIKTYSIKCNDNNETEEGMLSSEGTCSIIYGT